MFDSKKKCQITMVFQIAIDTCADTPTGETVDPNGCSDSQKRAEMMVSMDKLLTVRILQWRNIECQMDVQIVKG